MTQSHLTPVFVGISRHGPTLSVMYLLMCRWTLLSLIFVRASGHSLTSLLYLCICRWTPSDPPLYLNLQVDKIQSHPLFLSVLVDTVTIFPNICTCRWAHSHLYPIWVLWTQSNMPLNFASAGLPYYCSAGRQRPFFLVNFLLSC